MSKKFLGIDYGARKIGLALGTGSIATPLIVYKNTPDIFDRIADFIQTEYIETVVVGYPVSFAQKATDSSHAAVAFAEELKKKCSVPVLLFDEQLTSKQAASMGIRGNDDAHAAALMLQSFMDRSANV